MKLTTDDLKNERQWRPSTGYDQSGFCKFVPLFERTYLRLFGKSLPERQADGPKLFDNNYAPVRSFANLTEFEEYFRHHNILIIDATEQPIQRPGDQGEQKLNYSGKRKAHREK